MSPNNELHYALFSRLRQVFGEASGRTDHVQAARDFAESDLLFCVADTRGVVSRNTLREGTTVIDMGYCVQTDKKITGYRDIRPSDEEPLAVSPVPGGVDAVELAMLLQNTVAAAASNQILDWKLN